MSPSAKDQVCASPTLDELLRQLVETRASDLHLKPTRPPLMRINGRLTPLDMPALDTDTVDALLEPIVPEFLRPRLSENMGIDFGYGVAGVSRFRASIFWQRGTRAAVFRRVPYDFPSLEDWGLPPIIAEFCKLPQGLVLITGPTGSGKSSTLAAMIRRVADTRYHHIVTIEDPIEFLINDNLASVSQREIGIDTPSFSVALRNVLRQDPDVIMVGEMRDEETIRTVITAAETGHLVFSTLHTNSATQTIDRIVSGFREANHHQIRQQLASTLEAVVSLQLVPRADGKGLVAAVEILRRTPQISKLILEGELLSLYEAIESSVAFHKMQTMVQSLAALVVHGTITRETALASTVNPSELDLLLRKIGAATSGAECEPGDAMAEVTSDFSKILELQEVKGHYDDLQRLHTEEIAARDRVIADLRAQVGQASTGGGTDAQLAELQSKNQQLATQFQTCRQEYESKVKRLETRVRELTAKASQEPAPEPSRRGLFRR